MDQNLKHLEYLQHYYPEAEFWYVIRDPREVCRSIVQKVWGRYPHTYSLDDAITQVREVTASCWGWASEHAETVYYEDLPETHDGIDYTPKKIWPDYFTGAQINHIKWHIGYLIDELGYDKDEGLKYYLTQSK